jgi:hypothetical protein
MAQSLDRSLGLHCLLYLVPDRICVPETAHPEPSVADALSASKHRLARVVGPLRPSCGILRRPRTTSASLFRAGQRWRFSRGSWRLGS